MITTYEEIVEKVQKEYLNESTELNSLFFDFDVYMTRAELIKAYATLAETINGDRVVHIADASVVKSEDGDLIVSGFESVDNMLSDYYKGNMKDFLESFNGHENETGWYRIMDCEDNFMGYFSMIGGIKLDFVF